MKTYLLALTAGLCLSGAALHAAVGDTDTRPFAEIRADLEGPVQKLHDDALRPQNDPNDPGNPAGVYSWNGSACFNYLGQQGYTQLQSNIRRIAQYRANRFYNDRYGECYSVDSMNVSNLDLRDGNYQGAWFGHANLSQTKMDRSWMANAAFRFATLDQTTGIRTRWNGADFYQASAVNAQFYQANFSTANFDQATLRGSSFIQANLTGANFNKADASLASFNSSILTDANFQDAVFKNADFGAADLRGNDLKNADMSGTDLRYAKMTDAVSVNANLNGAVFDRCTKLPGDIDPGLPQQDRGQSRGMRYIHEPGDDDPWHHPCPQ